MKTSTKTVHLNANYDQVYGYLSNIENLPDWATNFCTEVKRDGDDYKVMTGGGEIYFVMRANADTGVLDMMAGPDKSQMATWPARVMALPDDSSLFSFTCVKNPMISDEEFSQQCMSVDHELEGLRQKFS